MGFSDRNRPDRGEPLDDSNLVPFRDMPPSTRLVYEEAAAATRGEAEEGSSQFWGIFRTLLRRRFLILAVVVLGMAASAVLTLRIVPLYRAATTLEVQARETQIIQGASVEPATVADAEYMGTQYALLKSRALAERVVENLKLTSDPRYANQKASQADRLAQAAGAVQGGLTVSPVRGARVIEVSFTSPSASETARIANAITDNFIEMNLERRYNATAYARRFLQERLDATRKNLEDSERRLVEYSRDQEIVDLSSVGGSDIGSSLDASSLVKINNNLTDAQNARITAEQRFREAKDNPSTREILESEAIKALRSAKSGLVTEYQQKLTTLGPSYPEMIQMSAKISAIDAEIEKERSNIVSSLEGEYRAAVSKETALRDQVALLKDQVQSLRTRSIDYNILHREVDTLRTQYDALLQRYKEVSISTGVGSSQVSVLDRARAPTFPFQPNFRSALIRAAALSLAAAIALALLVDFIDDTIKTPEDVATKLGLRVIGVIPKMKQKDTVSKLLQNPRSHIAEAFSSARTALQFAIMAESLRSIVVTGNRPSEGKTSTTLALGAAFAAIGKTVLIIDADMRRPSFAFNADASVGLSGVLTRGVAIADQIVAGPTANLFLLPSGVIPPNPAELLASPQLVHVLDEAMRAFDLVLVDSSPVLTFADAPILSSVCDATLVVMQSGAVRRPAARRMLERLRATKANLVGVILTKFDARRAGYGAAYGYGYSGYSDTQYKKLARAPTNSRRRIQHFAQDAKSPPSPKPPLQGDVLD